MHLYETLCKVDQPLNTGMAGMDLLACLLNPQAEAIENGPKGLIGTGQGVEILRQSGDAPLRGFQMPANRGERGICALAAFQHTVRI